MVSEIEHAAELIGHAQYMIALTGAGISRESNVPTFRGEDGLWRRYDPMELATPEAFFRDPDLVWEWYAWRQGLIARCRPNPAHLVLADWERRGLLRYVVTQNVDGLHMRAGSRNVLEVHGNIWRVRCVSCEYRSTLDEPVGSTPRCPVCGALLRPDVVWFGESLDMDVMARVYRELEKSDLCLVIGTSGVVQPAASFPLVAKQHGGRLIEINVEKTPLTHVMDVHIEEQAGKALPAIDAVLSGS